MLTAEDERDDTSGNELEREMLDLFTELEAVEIQQSFQVVA